MNLIKTDIINNLKDNWDEITFLHSIEDREFWDKIPKGAKKEILEIANENIHYSYPILPISDYLAFKRTGERFVFQQKSDKRRWMLGIFTLAECIENKGRFFDDALNGLWCTCEEVSWTIPSQNWIFKDSKRRYVMQDQEYIVDLFSAETAKLVSACYFILKNKVDAETKEIGDFIYRTIDKRIISNYLSTNHYWWLGFDKNKQEPNNWTTWIHANLLKIVLTLDFSKQIKIDVIEKTIDSLNCFLDGYQKDGGCVEGPGYWNHAGGALFECLEIIENLVDNINFFEDEKIKNIGKFIYRSNIDKNYFVNFSDSVPQLSPKTDIIFAYGDKIHCDELKELATFFYDDDNYLLEADIKRIKKSFDIFPIYRILRYFCLKDKIKDYKVHLSSYAKESEKHYYFPSLEQLCAHEFEQTDKGLFLAVKGGHNGVSHNHNDVGTFVVYYNGLPLIIDPGVGEYTKDTFSEKRYKIWTMQSQYHNCPILNNEGQAYGKQYHATKIYYKEQDNAVEIGMNIEKAYELKDNKFNWKRIVKLDESNSSITLYDEYEFEKESEIIIPFMLYEKPIIYDKSISLFNKNGDKKNLIFDVNSYDIKVDTITLSSTDKKLYRSWDGIIYRLKFIYKKKIKEGSHKFIIN